MPPSVNKPVHTKTPTEKKNSTILLVANWDSAVGYAWWLMESFWVTLAKRYSETHTVLLAYPSISTLPTSIQEAPLTTVTQPFSDSGLTSLLQECRFLRENLVTAIYFSDRPNYSLRYLAYRFCGVKLIIIHDHTPGQRTRPTGFKRAVKSFVHRIPLICADGFIGASNYVRQRFIDVCCIAPHRCFSAPNGIPERDHTHSSLSIRQEFNIAADVPIAVMTGRANHYKNIGFVLESLVQLKRENLKIHFIFCGDGPHLDELKEQAKSLGVAQQVIFAGRRNDIPALLPQCDFAVHPSKGEVGYSLSILEYMQSGLPVVVPDNPSVCEATTHGKTGLIYQEGDLAEFVAAMRQLAQDPAETKKMGNHAKEAVSTQYSLKQTHLALLNAIEKIDRQHVLAGTY